VTHDVVEVLCFGKRVERRTLIVAAMWKAEADFFDAV
jgi:hypothetical protein